MSNEIKMEKFKLKYYNDVKRIYTNSFPEEERANFKLLIFNLLRNCELYVLTEKDSVCGFIYLINDNNMTFILYLAIDNSKRSKGYGGYILNWCINYKKDKVIYLNIDELNEKFDDIEIRKKRLNFYLKNGFYLTDYLSVEEKCNFNIMSTSKTLDIDSYIKLDERIAKVLLDKKSSIEKVNK